MKRIRMVGLCLVAALAMSAVTAAAATAEPPEYGRCKHVSGKTGIYGNTGCTTTGGTKANEYEWTPGNVAGWLNRSFTTSLKPTTVVTLETVKGAKIVCTGESSVGQIVNNTNQYLSSFKLEGCANEGFPCTTKGQVAGTMGGGPLENDPGWINQSLLKVGMKLSPVDFYFKCTGGPYVTEHAITGSVMSPAKAGKMLSKEIVKYVASGGKQKPEGFEGQKGQYLSVCEGEETGGFCILADQIGLTMAVIQVNQEKWELNPVV